MTGWCSSCGKPRHLRHFRGSRLADHACACGGQLVGTLKVARALGVPSYGVGAATDEERVAALARSGS